MASLETIPQLETNGSSDDPLSKVGEAVREVFAMLQPSGTEQPSTDNERLKSIMGQTAIYDISARTVYMPDGSKLEAHSGLAEFIDDPGRVGVKDKGATPPQVYELSPREKRFHGVEALRMTPVGEGSMYGRSGFLTHSYLMGPKGDSNGCVSFKKYDAFLKAYKDGIVRKLVVVPTLTETAIANAGKL